HASVELQLGKDLVEPGVAHADIGVESRPGLEIVPGIKWLLHQRLREIVPFLVERAEGVDANQRVSGAGSGLQTTVQRLARLRTVYECVVEASRGQLDPELQAYAVVLGEAVITPEDPYVTDAVGV